MESSLAQKEHSVLSDCWGTKSEDMNFKAKDKMP